MFFGSNQEKQKCVHCSYTAIKPYPKICPKCGNSFSEAVSEPKSAVKDKEPMVIDQNIKTKEQPSKSVDLVKNLARQSNPNMVMADISTEQKPREIKQIEISKTKVTDSDDRIKVKVKKAIKIDFSEPFIDLGKGEYLKFMGIISIERVEVYASHPKYKFLLELAANLDFIASSILRGELDRMLLSAPDGGNEEQAYFSQNGGLIYIIYGIFPDKKATWLLNNMRVSLKEITKGIDVNKAQKIDLYNISSSFQKKASFMLEEYIKLEEVFTTKKLESLDNFLRIDYYGLSYQSIGVISQLLTNNLEITGLPPVDPNDENAEDTLLEFKESMITAKVEAIAANTVANTGSMPNWISVKLSFQHYRYLIFSQVQNYFISLLAEGNLDFAADILKQMQIMLKEVTANPFIGDLAPFKEVEQSIVKYLKNRQINLK